MALLMMGLAMNFYQYMMANFMLGLLSTAAAPVGTVLILESFKKEEWAKRLGDFSKVGGIGWVTGLVLGTIWLSGVLRSADTLAGHAGAVHPGRRPRRGVHAPGVQVGPRAGGEGGPGTSSTAR